MRRWHAYALAAVTGVMLVAPAVAQSYHTSAELRLLGLAPRTVAYARAGRHLRPATTRRILAAASELPGDAAAATRDPLGVAPTEVRLATMAEHVTSAQRTCRKPDRHAPVAQPHAEAQVGAGSSGCHAVYSGNRGLNNPRDQVRTAMQSGPGPGHYDSPGSPVDWGNTQKFSQQPCTGRPASEWPPAHSDGYVWFLHVGETFH